MFDRRSKLLSTITLLHDLGVTCVAFVLAYLLRSFLVRFPFFSGHFPEIYPFVHYLPLMVAFLLAWAVVGYFSSFYRDLELTNPIQLVLKIVSQLAIVLVVMYAGLYLLRRTDISRSYVLLIGGVDFVLLLMGRTASYWGVAIMRERLSRFHYLLIVGCGPRAREMATLDRRKPRHGASPGRLRRSRNRGPHGQPPCRVRRFSARVGGRHPTKACGR